MKPNPSPFTFLVVALLVGLASARAQTPSPAPAPSEAPRRARAISPEVAASLAAAMPKYTPPKPVEKKPEEELPDARETDKPKNGIVRLPKYVVREPKAPIFRERDINTPQGLANIAMKRYITETDRALNRWNLFGTQSSSGTDATTARALQMYAEDERLKNMADLKDDAGLVSARDKAAGAYILREAQQTTMRTGDYGWQNNRK